MEHFFNELCAPAEEPKFGEPPTSIVPRQFRKQSLRLMYQYVVDHHQEILNELNEFPAYEVKNTIEQLNYLTQQVGCLDEDNDGDDSSSDGSESMEMTKIPQA